MIPEDVWFILPEKIVRGMWSVGLYPKLETAKYREYQEAWHLLRGETPGFVDRIEACAEEDFLEEVPQSSTPVKCPTQAKGRLEWATHPDPGS